MGEATKELGKLLDDRYSVGIELLRYMQLALQVYQNREGKPEVNLPRCSKEHLAYIVKELKEYTEELHHVRCELPRLLENGNGFDSD